MAKTIATRRFGELVVDNEVLIRQPITEERHLRLWTLVASPTKGRLLWLQSTEDPDQAVPVISSQELGVAPTKGKFFMAKEGPAAGEMTVDTRKALIISAGKGVFVEHHGGRVFKVHNFLQRSALAKWAERF